jgi:hypothetical protein
VSTPSSAGSGRPRLMTDLVDESGYPIFSWRFLATVALLGVIPIAVTGLLGYPQPWQFVSPLELFLQGSQQAKPEYLVDGPVMQPWPLYIWLSSFIVLLQVGVLRDPKLRALKRELVLITFICIVVCAWFFFFRQQITLPSGVLHINIPVPQIYAILNYVLLLVFLGEALLRWIRWRRGIAPSPHIDLSFDRSSSQPISQSQTSRPSLGDLATGYLVTRGSLILLLAFGVRFLVPYLYVPCATTPLTWQGTCSANDTTTPLWLVDFVLALLSLGAGLWMLANLVLSYAEMRLVQRGSPATARGEVRESIGALIDILKMSFWWRGAATESAPVPPNIHPSLFVYLSPLLVFVGTAGAALSAYALQAYLHSPKLVWDNGLTFEAVSRFIQDDGSSLLLGLAGAIALIIGPVASMTIRLGDWRVAANTLSFLRSRVGLFIVPFGLLSIFLLIVNEIVLVFLGCYPEGSTNQHYCHGPRSHPFVPGILTLLILVVVLLIVLVSRGKNPSSQRSTEISE